MAVQITNEQPGRTSNSNPSTNEIDGITVRARPFWLMPSGWVCVLLLLTLTILVTSGIRFIRATEQVILLISLKLA